MNAITKLLTPFLVLLAMACTGGGTSTKPPSGGSTTPKSSYGIFRKPKSAAAPVATLAQAATVGSTMSVARSHHRSILMTNGKILIVGGSLDYTDGRNLDIFDPATEAFTKSSAKLNYWYMSKYSSGVYWDFTLTNLPDGRVLILGSNQSTVTNGVQNLGYEIYDPTNDTVTLTNWDTSAVGNSAATLVPSQLYYIGGNWLLGVNFSGGLYYADLTRNIQISTGLSLQDSNLPSPPSCQFVSSIQTLDNHIWLFGGRTLAGQVVPWVFEFDPNYGWKQHQDLNSAKYGVTLALLPGNKVGIYGGSDAQNQPVAEVETYDLSAYTTTVKTPLIGTRSNTTAVYLQTGYTLISGGFAAGSAAATDTEMVHNDGLNFCGSTGTMSVARANHDTINLPNGLVMITGGDVAFNPDATAEIYDPQAKIYVKYQTETMVVGSTMQLQAFNPDGSVATVTYQVSDGTSTFGSVDNQGLVTALAAGTVEVKVTNSTDTTITAIIRLNVILQ